MCLVDLNFCLQGRVEIGADIFTSAGDYFTASHAGLGMNQDCPNRGVSVRVNRPKNPIDRGCGLLSCCHQCGVVAGGNDHVGPPRRHGFIVLEILHDTADACAGFTS